MSGKRSWYIVDGYRPPERQGGADDYQGHECIMILNCNDEDGGCNAGITIEQWHEMHINGIECEKYDYIYETDDEN